MFTIQDSITIQRPVADVFAYLTNPRNIPEWRPEVLDVHEAGTPMTPGTTFEEVVNFMGRQTFTMQVVAYEPNQRVVLQAIAGPGARPTQTFEFDPTENGTRLSLQVEMRTSGLYRLMEPMMPRMIRNLWTGYLANLKNRLDAGRATPA